MMAIYNYPTPRSPNFKKPKSVEDCLPQARLIVKKVHGRAAMGPVQKGDVILIVTYVDQDEYVKAAVIQALKEEGAEKVDFMYTHELTGKEQEAATVEEAWREVEMMKEGKASGAYTVADRTSGVDMAAPLRSYFDKNPGYTKLFWDLGGRPHRIYALKEHGNKFKGNWLFNNWEEFLARTWTYPDELDVEIERKIIEALGKASAVRITDPEGTHLEFTLTAEEAKRWQMTAWMPGHLLLDPLQSTSQENAMVPVSPRVPMIFRDLNGILAGTANHFGFLPRIELYFEHGRLVNVKGGGKYGNGIREMMDRYKDVHWPGYPDKGYFWFCDCVLTTLVKAFRRTSDMFHSYWRIPNAPERNRAGVFHMGIGSRRHGEEHRRYAKENDIPMGHIHVHNYFVTFEIKLQGTDYWYKINDKGWVTAIDDPEIRAIATKYGDPNELLSYDWIPPLPGINCEGNYWQDYAPDPMAYLKKRLEEGRPI
jgi:hypothetical protein